MSTKGEEMGHKWIRALVSLAAVGTALAHVIWPALAIDGITATLLLVAVVPWLQPLFKSLALPGGVKVEFQELEKLTKEADSAGLLASPAVAKKQPPYSFQLVATTDPNLALAGLRIELEKRLDSVARAHGYDGPARGIGNLLRFLNSREVVNGAERGILSEMASVLNGAVHGAHVSRDAAEWALDLGPRLLTALDERGASGPVQYRDIAQLHSNSPTA